MVCRVIGTFMESGRIGTPLSTMFGPKMEHGLAQVKPVRARGICGPRAPLIYDGCGLSSTHAMVLIKRSGVVRAGLCPPSGPK